MKTQIALSVVTALSASICCITPFLTIIGTTGTIVTSVGWLEPFRPYLISVSFLVLGFAWFRSFKTKEDENCDCENPKKRSFFQSKSFLGAVTILSILLIAFPSYSKLLVNNGSDEFAQEQNKNKKIELAVSGMTCTSCELHIENEVKKLPGVSFVKASYEKKSAIIEFDEQKVDAKKIIAAINGTGYTVEQGNSTSLLESKANCTLDDCSTTMADLPRETNMNLKVITDLGEIKKAFNAEPGKVKFVAILSSTCKWCLQGVESVQKAVVQKMTDKNMTVIVVWTNMLKTDEKETAFHAASLFKGTNVVQYFDADNKFGNLAAKTLSPKGENAWDIYMFFDKDTEWRERLPRPFEYAHQLGSSSWADPTKYFCGNNLTKRLDDITASL